ncbi:MAG: hypothetical protein M1825_004880 [Sarcosagium campestre]|nr:MAG: hypothetical protein M1825_004880 [Sarcosagium campestre]
MHNYPALLKNRLLSRSDTRIIVQSLVNRLRQLKEAHRRRRNSDEASRERSELRAHALNITTDLRKRKLAPNPFAAALLLSFWKEDQNFDIGVELWTWLRNQDSSCTDGRTFGAALELLAAYGESLPNIEAVYEQAVQQIPDVAVQYQLSPGAMLPDRAQPTKLAGTSLLLLQGIIIARLTHNDWRNAYIALDTALRLHPTQISLTICQNIINERPLAEAYRVLLMAFRAGVHIRPHLVTSVIQRMVDSQLSQPDPSSRLIVALSALHVIHAFSGVSRSLAHIHVVLMARTLLATLPRRSGTRNVDDLTSKATSFESITPLLRQILDMYPREFVLHLVKNITQLGGKLGRQDVILFAQTEVERLGLQRDHEMYSTMLTAAGRTGDSELIMLCWENMQELASLPEDKDTPMDTVRLSDWSMLAAACKTAGCLEYAKQQFAIHEENFDTSTKSTVAGIIESVGPSEGKVPGPTKEISQAARWNPPREVLLSAISQKISAIQEVSQSTGAFSFKQTSSRLGSTRWGESETAKKCRAVYDELTIDTSFSSPTAATNANGPALSESGIELDTLRYEHWQTINELLVEANKFEEVNQDYVEDVIKQRVLTARRKRSKGYKVELLPLELDFNLPTMDTELDESRSQDVENLLVHALRLRGLDHKAIAQKHNLYYTDE